MGDQKLSLAGILQNRLSKFKDAVTKPITPAKADGTSHGGLSINGIESRRAAGLISDAQYQALKQKVLARQAGR